MAAIIVQNKIRCNHCGFIIESKSVNDCQKCICGCVTISGGHEYIKRTYKHSRADYTEMTIVEQINLGKDAP